MNPLLTDYNKILEGCDIYTSVKGTKEDKFIEKYFRCGNKDDNEKVWLCPSCQARKEVFLQRCQSELNVLKDKVTILYRFLDSMNASKEKDIIFKIWYDLDNEVRQLKEVLGQKK